MIPQIGMMVKYRLSVDDANTVNRRRRDTAAYTGNEVSPGDGYPMLIVRCWGETEESSVNGQVFLDGNDTLWVTSVAQGDGYRQWKDMNL